MKNKKTTPSLAFESETLLHIDSVYETLLKTSIEQIDQIFVPGYCMKNPALLSRALETKSALLATYLQSNKDKF